MGFFRSLVVTGAAGFTFQQSPSRHEFSFEKTLLSPFLQFAKCDSKCGNRPAFTFKATSLPSPVSYTYEEISKHKTIESRIWVTYQDCIYDVTDFVANHPGGAEKLMLAAGGAVDPFWALLKQHTNNPEAMQAILEPMFVGFVSDFDPHKFSGAEVDPYLADPKRDSELIIHTATPCNAETPNGKMASYITPTEVFFVRNHMPVPMVDEECFRLKIEGPGAENGSTFSLADLKTNFQKHKVVTTIQCSGNRRSEFEKIEKTMGTPWAVGACSTAEWGGVWLRDVLQRAGYQHSDEGPHQMPSSDNSSSPSRALINHVEFESLDSVRASIPIEKALNPFGDVMLAFEMNGDEIPRDHGFPLRAIVPGHVGVRNVKWVQTIRLREDEGEGMWQRGLSYKMLPNHVKDASNVEVSRVAAIQEMPVQSVISQVKPHHQQANDPLASDLIELQVSGAAWSGGGRGIVRVEVSADSGRTWQMAELGQGSEQKPNRAWAWTHWTTQVTVPRSAVEGKEGVGLCCKATDAAYVTQPRSLEDVWNIRGLNNNTWHRVEVRLNDQGVETRHAPQKSGNE